MTYRRKYHWLWRHTILLSRDAGLPQLANDHLMHRHAELNEHRIEMGQLHGHVECRALRVEALEVEARYELVGAGQHERRCVDAIGFRRLVHALRPRDSTGRDDDARCNRRA